MPAKDRPGKKGIYVELPEDVDKELRELVESLPLGGIAQHVIMAIRRHLASPPTVTIPDLPPIAMPSQSPLAKKGKQTR